MSSNLKVNTILPTTGTSIGIGTAGGVTTVSGAASVDTNLTLGGDIIHSGDDTKIRFPSNDLITFETAGNERVRIDSSGRLLLGRISASNTDSKMEIQASTDTYLRIASGNTGGSAGVIFGSSDDHSTGGIYYANSNDTLQFAGYNNTTRMTITSGGKINIGDADQTQTTDQFCVSLTAQNAVDNVARFQSTAAASGTSESLLKVYKGAGYGGVVSGYITQGSDHGLKLYTANNNSLSERLRINSSGYITTPSNVMFAANGGQSDLTNGVFVFSNVLFQRGGSNYNNSNGYFTAPVDGIYMFMCNPYRYADSNDSQITLQKSTNSGSSWSNFHEVRAYTGYSGDSGRGWMSLTMSTLMDLNKNDIVRIFASNRCHANSTVTVYSGMLVG